MNNQSEDLLFFCSFPPPNTGQTIATKLIHDCLTSEYSIDIINISDKKRLSRKSGAFSFRIIWLLINKIAKLIFSVIKKKYKIVYVVYAPSKSALIRDFISAWIIRKLGNAIIIAHLHNGNYGKNFETGIGKFFFDKLMKYTNKLVLLSPMLNGLNNIANNKVVYLPNMISDSIVCTDDEIEKKIIEKNKENYFNIFFISNMLEEKGYMDLLEAAKLLTGKTRDFTLHFAGSWPSKEKEEAFIIEVETCGLKEQTHIYGAIDSREKIKQMFFRGGYFCFAYILRNRSSTTFYN
jgi:glycosyltransferase involved in cell wall biosynthesis